jgi:hypothetical protein
MSDALITELTNEVTALRAWVAGLAERVAALERGTVRLAEPGAGSESAGTTAPDSIQSP